MTHSRHNIVVNIPDTQAGQPLSVAATIHMSSGDLDGSRPVLFTFPGGGYNRLYFDLPEPGYSEASFHVARGTVMVAIDHLAVGESSLLPAGNASVERVARANTEAVKAIVAGLNAGSFPGIPPVKTGVLIGEGQSMGGFILVAMQAHFRLFDAIAILGSSMVCTRMPSPRAEHVLRFSAHVDPQEAAAQLYKTTDWHYAFHWHDEPERLVAADMACKPPIHGAYAPWHSETMPDISTFVLPGAMAQEAAAIEVPVLIGLGQRDVCQDPLREVAAYQSATDLSFIVVPNMAHMHNFAGTREVLWTRVSSFVNQVSRSAALHSCE